MRVLIVNTSERTGGAAVAANRLMDALINNGVKARMMVGEKETEDLTVAAASGRWRRQWAFLWERWCVFCALRFRRTGLFDIDIANAGIDITRTREFQEADIIHLNWVNQGMLSLHGIKKIVNSGKPIVWTMHDFWPATAICHYPRECTNYASGQCHNCIYLPNNGSANDVSAHVWKNKADIWRRANIHFVACSRWLADKTRHSALLTGKAVTAIPNPIDSKLYRPADKGAARRRLSLPLDKRLILFVSQRVTDKRKGMDYLIKACAKLNADYPGMSQNTAVVVIGGHAEECAGQIAFPVLPLGYINDEKRLIDVYNAADVFVLPSLEDNLPNTIMEAMACALPCVGFNTGGIPEMIEHKKTGYVAEYKSSDDLATGMAWVLREADTKAIGDNAVRKVATQYSQQSVAMRYIEVYNQVAALNPYGL